jgi:hypothetical protein
MLSTAPLVLPEAQFLKKSLPSHRQLFSRLKAVLAGSPAGKGWVGSGRHEKAVRKITSGKKTYRPARKNSAHPVTASDLMI